MLRALFSALKFSKSPFHALVMLTTLATVALPIAPTSAATPVSVDPSSELVHAVRKMNYWLAGNSQAEGWRRFLLLNVLDAQSARGADADLATLQQVADRFHSGATGLEHPRFAEVRDAIDAQIESLSKQAVGDLSQALIDARYTFHRITIEEMSAKRDRAVEELKLVKRQYRRTMPSRTRANLFYDMQLDEMIEQLMNVELEIAPEVSVGKMDSMIRDVQKEINAVEAKLDALPFQPAPDASDPKQEGDSTQTPTEDRNQKNRQELQLQMSELSKRKKTLQAKRKSLLKEDQPRRVKRAATFRSLLQFEQRLVKVSKSQGDPFFLSAATAYEQFVRSYFYGTSDNLQEEYLERLSGLEKEVVRLEGPETRDAVGKIGDTLRWMENSNQGSDIVTAIRRRYSKPNAIVSVSADMINEIAGQTIHEKEPLRQQAGGRLLRGNSETNVNVSVDLVDDPNQVHASVHLLGTVAIGAYIEQGKLQVFTQACGDVEARRSIFANLGGVYAGDPIQAANFRVDFLGTSSRLKLINRIAAKKVAEAQTDSEGEAALTAEKRLREQLLNQTDELVSDGQTKLADALKKGLDKGDLFPEAYLYSTHDRIYAVARKDTLATLATNSSPIDYGVRPHVGVRIHESMLTNYLDKTFAGKTFTDKELAALIEESAGDSPDALAGSPAQDGEPEPEPFSITFASIRPIQIEFEDQGVAIVVSGRQFSQGDKKIQEGLNIILRFRVKSVNGKLKLVRNGDVDFSYPTEGKQTPRVVGFRSFLDGRLNRDPKAQDGVTETDLPDNLLPIEKIDGLKNSDIAKRLRLVQLRSENGWLYLGWNLMPEGDQWPNWIYDLPAVWNELTIDQLDSSYTPDEATEK